MKRTVVFEGGVNKVSTLSDGSMSKNMIFLYGMNLKWKIL